jgi:hypothetical protein
MTPKTISTDPEKIHNAYERWQQEKFGNILDHSDEEPEEDNEFDLSDFLNENE